ncbi:TetR/AcrR family transcriptional regulator [Nocardioides stalactiti]|uniref:TetR/AcrR family transcriptional regulator n=1 Tax=Nocardioides stalactiti TaxID=2755356 RepID=UPI001603C6E0|nr:TetR/AcrR family transcriptional regulator [Nocardioides stalactiti]
MTEKPAGTVRPYRGVSADDRRSLRRSQLLESCLDVVGDIGVVAATAEAVCARAGLSKRYFYESFGDRDTVLLAALDGVFDGARAAITPPLTDAASTPEERLRRTVAALVATLSADPRAARLYVESPRNLVLEQRRLAAYDEFADLLLRHVLAVDGGPVTDRRRAVALLIVSGTTEVMARWLAGDLDLAESEVVDTVSAIGIAAAAALDGS